MVYSIVINQKAVIDNGWDLSLNELAVFSAMHNVLTTMPNIKSIIHENKEWFWIDYDLIKAELPLLKHEDNWYRNIIKKLKSFGLIDVHPENQILGKTYFKIGNNAHKLFRQNDKNEADPSIQSDRPPLSNPIDPSIQSDRPPLSNPIDNNYTNYNYTNNHISSSSKENDFEIKKNNNSTAPAADLPNLEEIKKISAAVFLNQIWVETIAMTFHLSKLGVKQWMNHFDLSIASSEGITNINQRKYMSLFHGWLRQKVFQQQIVLKDISKKKISENTKEDYAVDPRTV